jgi:hypothetical protein
VTCDGIKKAGDWTTSKGSREQITTAANHPGGGGGRGQRHWVGQSSGNTNGSGEVFFEFASRQQELYIRWFTRWQAGLKIGGNTAPIVTKQKLVYFVGQSCGMSGGCVIDVEGGSWSWTVAGTSYTCGTGWAGLFGSGSAPSDGRWISLELHIKNATSGQTNGIFQVWVDGAQVCKLTNIDFKGSTGFSGFLFPENGQFTVVGGADMYQDLDDVEIRTTGPIGPSSSVSAPAAPVNLRIVK